MIWQARGQCPKLASKRAHRQKGNARSVASTMFFCRLRPFRRSERQREPARRLVSWCLRGSGSGMQPTPRHAAPLDPRLHASTFASRRLDRRVHRLRLPPCAGVRVARASAASSAVLVPFTRVPCRLSWEMDPPIKSAGGKGRGGCVRGPWKPAALGPGSIPGRDHESNTSLSPAFIAGV